MNNTETHSGEEGVRDMISLKELTEESILNNIKIRYAKKAVYVSAKLTQTRPTQAPS